MDISVTTEDSTVEDRSWLGSAHGTDACESVTLDVSTFTAEDHYPNGYIPSGIAAVELASGLFGVVGDATAVEGGRSGHIFSSVKVRTDDVTVNVGAALLTHGKVRLGLLPDNHGVDAGFQADAAGRLIYI